MTTYSGQQQLAFDTEAAWAENVTTFTYEAPLAAPIEISGVTQQMLDPERVTARRNEYSKGVLGPWNIAYSTTHNLTGHGSTCAGAITATAQARILGHVLGGRDTTLAAGTTATGGTATVPTLTAASGFPAGGMVRFGSLTDGDGEGQFIPFSTHASNNLNALLALDGAPAATQVVYSPELVYPADSGSTMTGMRHRIMSAGLQWAVHGVFPTGISFSGLGPGENPKYTINWTGSWAQPLAATFPGTTPDQFNWQQPSAGGSLVIADHGATTRTRYGVRAFAINYTLGMIPVMGGNGVNQYQVITGATRAKDTIQVSLTVDNLQSATTTPTWWDKWFANTNQHLCYTLHSVDGTAVGFYFRLLHWTANRPSQTATNDRNTIPLVFQANNGSTTTSDLTLSSMLLAIA